MSISLEFLMDNGQVITFDSYLGDAINHPDLAGSVATLDCSAMAEEGITMDQYAVLRGGEVVKVAEGIRVLGPEDTGRVYKAYQNNRLFMETAGYRLLNPTETEVLYDSIADAKREESADSIA